MTPFRSEKDTNWEGAIRVPWLVRWPGVIKQPMLSGGKAASLPNLYSRSRILPLKAW
jgi:hypothetical protein